MKERCLFIKLFEGGYKIKVVEKTGTTLKEVLLKSNPFKQQRCGREDCMVCKQAGKGPCNAHGVAYEIECQGCENKYVGETARNAYTRGTEHAGGLRESRREISIMEALRRESWEETTRVQNVRNSKIVRRKNKKDRECQAITEV